MRPSFAPAPATVVPRIVIESTQTGHSKDNTKRH